MPVITSCCEGGCHSLGITLNGTHYGLIRRGGKGWKLGALKPQGLVNALGAEIEAAYARPARPKILKSAKKAT